jgi:hypothetical protein
VWELGGFAGTDPHPTLDGFRAAVTAGRVHYLVLAPGAVRRGTPAAEIVRWATTNRPSTKIGDWLLYELRPPVRPLPPD